MTLNKASLFQLTQDSQLNITVSAHVCTNVYAMHNVVTCIYLYLMTCVCMYVFIIMFIILE